MTYSSGTTGYLYVKLATENTWVKGAAVKNWSLVTAQSVLDTTTLEDTDRTLTNGLRTTSGTCSLFYYQPTAGNNTGNTASWLVHELLKQRSAGAIAGVAQESQLVDFRLGNADGRTGGAGDPAEGGHFIEVSAYLTGAQIRMGVGEVYSADVTFDVQGAPTQMRY